MSYTPKQTQHVDVPDWATRLRHLYWVIRVERYSKVKRRRYYRYVFKEKLRLVEMGYEVELVNAIYRYYCELSIVSSRRLQEVIDNPNPQMRFNFNSQDDNLITLLFNIIHIIRTMMIS